MNLFSLYLVTPDEDPFSLDFFKKLELILKHGITALQFRNKYLSDREFCLTARAIAKVTEKYKIPLILNDRYHLVPLTGAQGVHVGQSDACVHKIREKLGKQAIIGLSIESEAQNQAANASPVNYIAASPVFSSKTKKDTANPLKLEGLHALAKKSIHPTLAIGGISHQNAHSVLQHGACGLAIISEIWNSPDPAFSTKKFKSIIKKHHENL